MEVESNLSSFINKLSKGDFRSKEVQLAVVGAAGAAVAAALINYYYKKTNSKAIHLLKVPEGEVVKVNNVNAKQFLEVVKTYGEKFNSSRIFEKVLPRVFKDNTDLEGVCSDLRYSKKYDIVAVSKVSLLL